MPDLSMLKVLNKNPVPFTDYYDGIPFSFEPKKPINIPPDAALHIFGYPGGEITDELRTHMQRHTTRRWGINTPTDLAEKRDEKVFRNFDLKPVFFQVTEVDGEPATA